MYRKYKPAMHAVTAACVLVCGSMARAQETQPVKPAEAIKIAAASGVQFDEGILSDRGINPRIAEYFRSTLRFTPGPQTVQVIINGASLGRKQALFDSEGALCFTPEFVRFIGLRPMDQPANQAAGSSACPDYRVFAPRMVVTPQPSTSAVELTVPAEYVEVIRRAEQTEHGGMGAMLNYRGYVTNSSASNGSGSTYRYRYLDTTAGFNIGDWLVRSRQDYSSSDGQDKFAWRAAYAQKTFEDQKQVLQLGRITTQDPLFGGLPLTGAQWFPERALYGRQVNFAITGVAATRARVEIRQNGVLLFNTVVPSGPFSLTEYPLQNRNVELQVRIIEDTGSEQAFTVPATSLMLAASNAQLSGWSFAGGQFWDQTQNHVYRQAAVASGSRGWARDFLSGTFGGVVAPGYLGGGAAANIAVPDQQTSIFGQVLASHDSDRGLSGMLGSLAAGGGIGTDLKVGVSGSMRSSKYRSLQESLAYLQPAVLVPYGYSSQLGATLGWNAGSAGGFTAGVTRENYFYGDPGHIATLNWNKTWARGVSVNVGLAHRTARLSPLDVLNLQNGQTRQPSSNYAYASLSFPLGTGVTSRSFAQRTDGVDRVGTAIDQRINEFFGYRASVEQVNGAAGNGTGTSLSAYGTPYFTSLGGGVSRVRHYDSTYAEASGAVVATKDGVAFSPYAVQDSFGTVRTGDVNLARIETPQGPVWSAFGLAALAGLAPYQESRVEVGGTSIPLNIDVENGLLVVQASRGAVLQLDMGMRLVQRRMLVVSLPDGTPLPTGTAVVRGNEYFTIFGQGGRALITQLNPGEVLQAVLADGKRCTIGSIKPSPRADGDYFERASAICQ